MDVGFTFYIRDDNQENVDDDDYYDICKADLIKMNKERTNTKQVKIRLIA
jgi:hypothetical protein